MFFSWFKNRDRLARPAELFPRAWDEWLGENVRQFAHLSNRRRAIVREVVRMMVAQKTWVGGGRFGVTDEMKVTIAGQAALLVLGLDEPYTFDRVLSIIVYEGPYERPVDFAEGVPTYGEAWYRGPIVLSWREVLAAGRDRWDGNNVVLHEFAHYLDALDGDFDGSPPLDGPEQSHSWHRTTQAEYFRLVGQAQRNEVSLLNHYGASNRAEFFAVATECFFERPRAMRQRHEELYGVLRDFYRQDPAQWLPDATVAKHPRNLAPPRDNLDRKADAVAQRLRRRRLAVLRCDDPDRLFTLAVAYLGEGRPVLAARAATRAIAIAPDDGEIYCHRAMAQVARGRYADALADCDVALRLDPKDNLALRTRGAALVGLGRFEQAKADLDRVVANDRQDVEARYHRGRAFAGLGNYRRAIADLLKASVNLPHDAVVRYHLALAYRAAGKTQSADVELAKALQLDPDVALKT